MLYFVLGTDSKEYGPADLDDIRQWLQEGRMDSLTRVREENSSEWKLARAMAELRPLVSAIPAPGSPRPVRKSLALTGFVLGLLAFILGPLTGLPGLLYSLLAHHRARHMPESYGGASWAMGGFVLNVLGMLLCVTVLPSWIIAASRNQTQALICRANLKHIGVALGTWRAEHGEYPFLVGTNAGGSLELRAPGSDGFDPDSYRHFAVVADQLYSPRTITCPKDTNALIAASFVGLSARNTSYILRTDNDRAESQHHERVLAVCPSHGFVLLTNGDIETLGARAGAGLQ